MRFRVKNSYSRVLAPITLSCTTLFLFIAPHATAAPPETVVAAASESTTKSIPGWKLDQESYSSGRFDVFLSTQAIRIVNQKTGIVIVSQSPSWKPFVIDDTIKSFCAPKVEELGNGLGRTLALFGAPVFTDMPVVLTKKSKDGEMELESYGSPPGFAAIQKSKIRNLQITANAAIDIKYKIWKSDFPKEECKILSLLYGLPSLNGIPMGFLNTNQNDHTHRELTTKSAVHADFTPKMFLVPKGYHQAKSIEELRATNTQNEGIDMVLNRLVDPDINEPGKHKAAPAHKNADVKQ